MVDWANSEFVSRKLYLPLAQIICPVEHINGVFYSQPWCPHQGFLMAIWLVDNRTNNTSMRFCI